MIAAVDLMHLGRAHVICAYEREGVIVDPGPTTCLDTLLAGIEAEPRAVLLTHIHLDHAGATGHLVERFPGLKVYVHESGAPHMVDNEKLLRSATRLYGDHMDRLWGEMRPVPAENVVALEGGEEVEGLRVAHTPGHASHHIAYLDESTGDAFTGDVAGVRVPGTTFAVPPTPPPEIDVEAWERSLDLLEQWGPRRLCLTHFGTYDDAAAHLAQVRERLEQRAAIARGMTAEQFGEWSHADAREHVTDDQDFEALAQAAPPDQLGLGLRRYWDKVATA